MSKVINTTLSFEDTAKQTTDIAVLRNQIGQNPELKSNTDVIKHFVSLLSDKNPENIKRELESLGVSSDIINSTIPKGANFEFQNRENNPNNEILQNEIAENANKTQSNSATILINKVTDLLTKYPDDKKAIVSQKTEKDGTVVEVTRQGAVAGLLLQHLANNTQNQDLSVVSDLYKQAKMKPTDVVMSVSSKDEKGNDIVEEVNLDQSLAYSLFNLDLNDNENSKENVIKATKNFTEVAEKNGDEFEISGPLIQTISEKQEQGIRLDIISKILFEFALEQNFGRGGSRIDRSHITMIQNILKEDYTKLFEKPSKVENGFLPKSENFDEIANSSKIPNSKLTPTPPAETILASQQNRDQSQNQGR